MSNLTGNKIGIVVYLDPDAYRHMENMRSPSISKSTFYSTVLEEAFGIRR